MTMPKSPNRITCCTVVQCARCSVYSYSYIYSYSKSLHALIITIIATSSNLHLSHENNLWEIHLDFQLAIVPICLYSVQCSVFSLLHTAPFSQFPHIYSQARKTAANSQFTMNADSKCCRLEYIINIAKIICLT